MAVLQPILVTIDNYPEEAVETLTVANHPQNPAYGQRTVSFGREIYIDADDFSETYHPDFFRLTPGGGVRLRNAYVIYCDRIVKDEQGRVVRLHCHYDAATGHGAKPRDGSKIKGIIHWVFARDAVDATVRRYDRLFDAADTINDASLTVYHAKVEPILARAQPEERFQLMRIGYVISDRKEHRFEQPVFNEIVGLQLDRR